MNECDPQKIILSSRMRQRIACGNADETQVRTQTAHLFTLADRLEGIFVNDTNEQTVPRSNILGQEYLAHLKENRDNIDLDALGQSAHWGKVNLLTLAKNTASFGWSEARLDGVIHLTKWEEWQHDMSERLRNWTSPVAEANKVHPWGKITMDALIEAGADPIFKPASSRQDLAYGSLLSMEQANLIVLLNQGVRLTRSGERIGTKWQQERTASYNGRGGEEDLFRVQKFQQFLDDYYDRAEALQKRLDSGEITPLSLKRDDICLLSLIQRHHAVFAPAAWRGKEKEALSLILSLPPFLQQELSVYQPCFITPKHQISTADSIIWNNGIAPQGQQR